MHQPRTNAHAPRWWQIRFLLLLLAAARVHGMTPITTQDCVDLLHQADVDQDQRLSLIEYEAFVQELGASYGECSVLSSGGANLLLIPFTSRACTNRCATIPSLECCPSPTDPGSLNLQTVDGNDICRSLQAALPSQCSTTTTTTTTTSTTTSTTTTTTPTGPVLDFSVALVPTYALDPHFWAKEADRLSGTLQAALNLLAAQLLQQQDMTTQKAAKTLGGAIVVELIVDNTAVGTCPDHAFVPASTMLCVSVQTQLVPGVSDSLGEMLLQAIALGDLIQVSVDLMPESAPWFLPLPTTTTTTTTAAATTSTTLPELKSLQTPPPKNDSSSSSSNNALLQTFEIILVALLSTGFLIVVALLLVLRHRRLEKEQQQQQQQCSPPLSSRPPFLSTASSASSALGSEDAVASDEVAPKDAPVEEQQQQQPHSIATLLACANPQDEQEVELEETLKDGESPAKMRMVTTTKSLSDLYHGVDYSDDSDEFFDDVDEEQSSGAFPTISPQSSFSSASSYLRPTRLHLHTLEEGNDEEEDDEEDQVFFEDDASSQEEDGLNHIV